MITAFSLQSGSSGNAFYVEAGEVRLLFDAGISAKRAEQNLAVHGKDMGKVDAVLISHDHFDHVRSAGVYSRKYGFPVWMTEKTLHAARYRLGPANIPTVRHFVAGDVLSFGDVRVETHSTPHDGADGVVFIVCHGPLRLGIMTDLGHVFETLPALVASVHGIFLESNYDEFMLEKGPYPHSLKARIAGSGGHISNSEAATLLAPAFDRELQWACLCHLSNQNNSPEVLLRAHRQHLGDVPSLHIAPRYDASVLLTLSDNPSARIGLPGLSRL